MAQQASSGPTDEFGTRWRVEAGDPARPLLNYLERRGFRTVVLPRSAYLAGSAGLVVSYEPSDVLSRARLLECVGVLLARSSR